MQSSQKNADTIDHSNATAVGGNFGVIKVAPDKPRTVLHIDSIRRENRNSKQGHFVETASNSSALKQSSGSVTTLTKDLFASINEVQMAIDLFFDNKFEEAKELTSHKASTSMYHAIGHTSLLFLEAVMTFDTEAINHALESIKSSVQVCSAFRKKKNITSSVGQLFGLTSHQALTDVEKHAELIFAELNLFRAALTFVQDENLVSFIRGALKIRTCYQTYISCLKIAEKLNPTPENMQFIGGVFVGCGFFNIGLSLLPPRVLTLLEWIGFTANKAKGKEQLLKAYHIDNLRSSLISIYILSYNFFFTVHLAGTHDADLNFATDVLDKMFQKYPNGIFFHLFAGRLEQLKGNFDMAISCLETASTLQSEWRQFSHICFWELMWCHAFKMEWEIAASYAEILSSVQKLMQRFSGKSIPTEKFLARKSRKFLEQNGSLFLPVHEMLYCWNGLVMLKENNGLRAQHMQLFRDEAEKLEEKKRRADAATPPVQFDYYDDFCLLQLLKGTLHRFDNEEMKAETCFLDVQHKYEFLKKDHYLAPAALSDLSWLMIDQERYDEASSVLKHIRKTYVHYSMESRIHFRIHAAQTRLDQVLGEMASTS